jgi:hypothetical protein
MTVTFLRNRTAIVTDPEGTARRVSLEAPKSEAQAVPDAPQEGPELQETAPEAVRIEPGPIPPPLPASETLPSASPSREALRTALTVEVLADILRHASVAISELDGAGTAGEFSRTEAAQIAWLVYEPTLGVIERYFGGNVDRFKLFLAVTIIVLAKGRIHARAIGRKLAERKAQKSAEDQPILDREEAWAQEQAGDANETTDPEDLWLRDLARKQRQWSEAAS